jgi:hypothetical protein
VSEVIKEGILDPACRVMEDAVSVTKSYNYLVVILCVLIVFNVNYQMLITELPRIFKLIVMLLFF